MSMPNVDEVRKVLKELGDKQAAQVLGSALHIEALHIMQESQRQVPVDTGILRASGTVLPPETDGRNARVVMGYGGAASDYATIQHERLDFAHRPPGKAKYLEDPLQAHLDGPFVENMVKRIQAWIDDSTKDLR